MQWIKNSIIGVFVCALSFGGLAGCASGKLTPPPSTSSTALPVSGAQPIPWFTGYDGELAFVADGDVYVMHSDGSNRRQLTHTPTYEGSPTWSPDGTQMAFVSYQDGNEEIYAGIVDLSGRFLDMYNLTQNPAQDRAPVWSPDGSRIAFVSNRDERWGVFVIYVPDFGTITDTDERGDEPLSREETDTITAESPPPSFDIPPLRLSYNHRLDTHPTWSLDSKYIAFTTDRGYRWDILLTSAYHMEEVALEGIQDVKNSLFPTWSPDGQRLAFCANPDGNWEIYTIKTDGTDMVRLTQHPAYDIQPAWTPDGAWLTFTSNRDGDWDLYAVHADGSALARVTDDPAVETNPVWRNFSP